MKTNLKPYNPLLYSPVKRLPLVGELAICLSEPRGYVVVITADVGDTYYARFLDETESKLKFNKDSLIPTGKTPQDLENIYPTSDEDIDSALMKERSPIDFTQIKKRSATKSKVTKKNATTEAQKRMIEMLLRERLQELKDAGKLKPKKGGD